MTSLYMFTRVAIICFQIWERSYEVLSFKSKPHYRPPIYVAIAAMGAKCFKKYLFVVFTIKASFE